MAIRLGLLLYLAVLSVLFQACSTESSPTSFPSNLSFSFSGQQNGSFELFKSTPDAESNFFMYGGSIDDKYLTIVGIRWVKKDSLADIITINLQSQTPLVQGQLFKSDSSTSHVDAVIGFSAPIKTTHDFNRGDVYSILDSSGFQQASISFTLQTFDTNPSSYSVVGLFSGAFSNSKNEVVTVNNGRAYFHMY